MKCDVCGKNLTMSDGTDVSALQLQFRNDTDKPDVNIFMEAFMGVYELGYPYSICAECWLRSLGIKPKIEQ